MVWGLAAHVRAKGYCNAQTVVANTMILRLQDGDILQRVRRHPKQRVARDKGMSNSFVHLTDMFHGPNGCIA